MADDTGAGNGSQQNVDLEALRAQIRGEVEQSVSATFGAKLKEITGVDSLDLLAKQRKSAEEAQFAEQGKFKELAEAAEKRAAAAEQEAADTVARLHGHLKIGAIVSEAAKAGAVDPGVVGQLLSGKAKVGDDDAITVDGKPTAEAVKAFLAAHPYLAAASGNHGSGAGAHGHGHSHALGRKAFDALDGASREKHIAEGGTVTDQ